jgi:hypothetical protein
MQSRERQEAHSEVSSSRAGRGELEQMARGTDRGARPDGRKDDGQRSEDRAFCLPAVCKVTSRICAGAICAAPRTEGTLQTHRERDTKSGAWLFAGPATTKRERAEMAKL